MKYLTGIGLIIILFSILFLSNSQLNAATFNDKSLSYMLSNLEALMPQTEIRVHTIGNTRLTITDFGMYGSLINEGYVNPENNEFAESCEHPAGSLVEYLFQGALWIGAVVNGDTLVSVGCDGWQHVYELMPLEFPNGPIQKRSNNPDSPDYHSDAISEVDYIAYYTDFITDPMYVAPTPFDGRPHIPLGVLVVQSSYSWSNPEYEDFIIFKYVIYNLGSYPLEDMTFGLYFDTDIHHKEVYPGGRADDITGFYSGVDPASGRFVQIGWAADNDGDPYGPDWFRASARDVFGISLLDIPGMQFNGYNWWISREANPQIYDWGPMRTENYRNFGTGGMGTPEGDCNKYYMMRNKEIDYDQLFSALDHTDSGWEPKPAPQLAPILADGFDTRFLMSFGSAYLENNDSVVFAFVLTVGDDLHQNPENFVNLFNPDNPEPYYNTFDFSDLVSDVVTAQNLYDSIFHSDYLCGDANNDGTVQIGDAVYIINYIFIGGLPPYPYKSGDANCDDKVNITDVIYLINYLFRDGFLPGDPDGDGIPDC